MSKNEFYDVKFDQSQNFLKVKVKGFWADEELYDHLEKEIESELAKAILGWKMMIDLTEFLTPPQQFAPKIASIQKILVQNGLKKIAEVLPHSVIAKMAIDRISDPSGLQRHQFASVDEAIHWLNEL